MNYRYPKSFPDTAEREFFAMLFADEQTFSDQLIQWINHNDFNATPYAISRLLPLVYHRIRNHKSPIQTTDAQQIVINKIKGIYKLAWYKNHSLLNDLHHVTSLLHSSAIPAVALKGTALLLSQPSGSGVRFQNDIDLLIRCQDVRTVISLFKRDGWVFTDPHFSIIEEYSNEKLLSSTNEVTFSRPGSVDIDLHWNILRDDSSHVFTDYVWKTAIASPSHPHLLIPSAESLLLHVIIHGSHKNDVRPIRWVSDALTIIQQQTIKWRDFGELVQSLGFHAEAYCAIRYLKEFHPALIPHQAEQLLGELTPSKKQMRSYLSKTDTLVVPFLGNTIKLWHGYRSQNRIASPLVYFAQEWKLGHPKHIPRFVAQKLIGRITNTLHRFGIFLDIN